VHHLAAGGCAVEVSFALFAELHRAVLEREESVILAHADIFSGENYGAALTHEDRARLCDFSSVKLRSEELWLGVGEVF